LRWNRQKLVIPNNAARLIDGTTLHRAFRLDCCDNILNADISSFKSGDVLFVDEISMISADWYSVFAKLLEHVTLRLNLVIF